MQRDQKEETSRNENRKRDALRQHAQLIPALTKERPADKEQVNGHIGNNH